MSAPLPEANAGLDAVPSPEEVAQILAHAAARRADLGLHYAGAVTPPEAWRLMRAQRARLIDVRTNVECHFVGRVPDTPNIEWHGGDPRARELFLHQLREVAREDEALLLLCRSGVRSHRAAEAATAAGFRQAYNVLEGFEGKLDSGRQRGRIDGWRFHGLPWIQD
jgi:rhodanese-related sulfurtransferase